MSSIARIVPGTSAIWNDRLGVILDLVGLDKAVLRDVESGETQLAPVSELRPSSSPIPPGRQDLMQVPDEDWNEAWSRYQLIRPLLEIGRYQRTMIDVQEVATSAGKNLTTIYRWLQKYEETGVVSSLLRSARSDRGNSRLPNEVELMVDAVIKEFHLTEQRRSITETCLEVARKCREAGIHPPHPNTIRNRISEISEKVLFTKRMGYKAARERFQPILGSFPNADFPLAVVQIDHTPVDLILVDDLHRLPIGRPYLTLAIDVYSRMIAGFYVTLDPPGALSAGLCISHAILTKDMWLAKCGIATSWPIWGKMRKIYVDNAKEFRGVMLERGCNEHGIVLEHRPKGQPNYGGHVERAFRTFMSKAHTLPGTTFSNVAHRADYDSEGQATMTLGEFEQWFTVFVVEVYHQRPHKGICNTPPIKAYEKAILGSPEQPGIGLPMRVANEQKLRLDFMPFVERTIQEYGVVIDGIRYYSDVLRQWIHAVDKSNAKLKRKFIFARDPRDISVIHFLDPESKTYSPIPYRDASRPAISLWELKAILKRMEADESIQPNEDLIFDGIRKMREIEIAAIASTRTAKHARRNQQRREQWKQSAATRGASPNDANSPVVAYEAYPQEKILPFDDIQEAN